jgi:hypothetical protein
MLKSCNGRHHTALRVSACCICCSASFTRATRAASTLMPCATCSRFVVAATVSSIPHSRAALVSPAHTTSHALRPPCISCASHEALLLSTHAWRLSQSAARLASCCHKDCRSIRMVLHSESGQGWWAAEGKVRRSTQLNEYKRFHLGNCADRPHRKARCSAAAGWLKPGRWASPGPAQPPPHPHPPAQ